VAARITRLAEAKAISREVAACMHVIREMRNVTEYEGKTLSEASSRVAVEAWKAIKEWAGSLGLEL
jgi:hypothetical protein